MISGVAASRWTIALLAALVGCDLPQVELCGEIPEDGCPLGRGGTCDDALCAALYDCVSGEWTLAEECPDFVQGGGGQGASGAGGGEGGACFAFDHGAEVDGCTPDLQPPDCPAAAAELCAADACLTGCVDFYLCEARGWVLVGFCSEEGDLVVVQGSGQ